MMMPDKKFCSKYNCLFSRRERGPAREQRRCCHSPLPTRWSRRVRQSSASLWEAGTSGTGRGMAGKQMHSSSRTHTDTHHKSNTHCSFHRDRWTSKEKNKIPPQKTGTQLCRGLKSSDSLLLTSSKVSTNAQLGCNEKTNLWSFTRESRKFTKTLR